MFYLLVVVEWAYKKGRCSYYNVLFICRDGMVLYHLLKFFQCKGGRHFAFNRFAFVLCLSLDIVFENDIYVFVSCHALHLLWSVSKFRKCDTCKRVSTTMRLYILPLAALFPYHRRFAAIFAAPCPTRYHFI